MLPLFDGSPALFVPVVRGVLALALVAVGGMATVVGLVIRADRRAARRPAAVGSIRPPSRPRLHEAA
jgi:hypothetical protein